jgi:hypothetical protein
MTTLQNVDFAAADAEVPVNENFETLSAAGIFGKRQTATTGLAWGYYGGRYNGNTVADGALTLADDDTSYIVVERATGDVSSDIATTDWVDTTNFARLYQVTTTDGFVTAVVDSRFDTGGLLNGGGGGGGGGGGTRTDVTALATSGSVAVDWDDGDYFTLALAGNVSGFTFSNVPDGATLMIRITQDSTPRTVAWPASFKWAAGVAGTVSTDSGAIDLLAITTHDAGTSWLATLAKDWS